MTPSGTPGAEPTWPSRSYRRLGRALSALTLRAKLAVITMGMVLAALVMTTIATTATMNGFLVGQADQELDQLAHTVAVLQLNQFLGQQDAFPTNFSLRVVERSRTIRVSDAIDAGHDEPDLSGLAQTQLESGEHFTVPSADGNGTEWRLLGGPIIGTEAAYVVATPMDTLRAISSTLQWRTAAIGLAMVGLCGIFGWYAVRRALRPVADIETTAAAIAAGDRSRRIPEPDTDDEVASLARSLNAMLTQIEQSLDRAEASEGRMRRFIADASHELRTPLVAIRGYAELYRQGAVTEPADVAASMRRIEDEAHRMSAL